MATKKPMSHKELVNIYAGVLFGEVEKICGSQINTIQNEVDTILEISRVENWDWNESYYALIKYAKKILVDKWSKNAVVKRLRVMKKIEDHIIEVYNLTIKEKYGQPHE